MIYRRFSMFACVLTIVPCLLTSCGDPSASTSNTTHNTNISNSPQVDLKTQKNAETKAAEIGINPDPASAKPDLSAISSIASPPLKSQPVIPTHQTLTINGHRFNLELALTDSQRFQGLSDRLFIANDEGMLFVFPDSKFRGFVMRRCLVPIDIVFLDPFGRVVGMHAMRIEPYNTSEYALKVYRSTEPAQFALEFAGGTLRKLSLKPGDIVQLPYQDFKHIAQ